MRIVIATTYVPFVKGGGRQIVDDLHEELAARGFEVDTVRIPLHSDWSELEEQTVALRLLDLSESCGNRVDRLITVRYPSYAIRHPNKVAWFLHHHREAYDLWGTRWCSMPHDEAGRRCRERLHRCDKTYLEECQKVYPISGVVAGRLEQFNDLEADEVLYPPLPRRSSFRPGPFGDYLLYPSRLTPMKRQALAVRALRYADPAVRLVIAGAADLASYWDQFHRLIEGEGVADRVRVLGWVSEEEKVELLAGCCGVLFLPFDEDYGYVTLEAFHAGKPVITLTDSGGPLELVRDGLSGLVAEPDPEALARAMDRLWNDRARGRALGAGGLATLRRLEIDWDHVVEKLTA